jgi:LysM domain.
MTDSQNSTTSQQSQGTTSNTNSNSNNSTDSTTSDSSNSDSSSATSYYTVKAGDNWFRIALNNNLTTAQLKNLNGGVSSLTPGTQLRVK